MERIRSLGRPHGRPRVSVRVSLWSVSYISVKLWNDLPNDFEATTYFTDLKRLLQTRTRPDLDYPFRSYAQVLVNTLLQIINFVSNIESRFLCLCLHFLRIIDCIVGLLPWANRPERVGYQVGGSRISMHGTQTRCATWFSIVVRRSTYRANGIPTSLNYVKLCVELNHTGAAIGEKWGDLAIRHIVFILNRGFPRFRRESVCDRHVDDVDSTLKGGYLERQWT